MTRLWSILSWCLIALVPLFVLFGLEQAGPRPIAVLLVTVAVLRFLLAPRANAAGLLAPTALFLLALAVLWTDNTNWFRYYPVAINGLLLALFGASLGADQTVIERLARLGTPHLPPAAVLYTRRVTQVWCVFFLLNGAIALYTAIATSLSTWALYNGAISYLLMGLLLGGEYLLRRRVQRAHHA